jgi:hypothetical protein
MKSLTKRYHDRLVKEARQREAGKILDEQMSKRAKYYDIVMLYTLHTLPKIRFGAQRCREFYLGMIRNHLGMVKNWQCDGDDSHFWIMEERLKADGINVDELIKEAHEIFKEDCDERNT